MSWKVTLHGKVSKALPKMPQRVQQSVAALILDIERNGPVRGNWPNYGKLGGRRHHCHVKKGSPCYVAVWREDDETKCIQLVEMTYVGTHEKAPY